MKHGAMSAKGTPGELEVRGPAVFLEYWQRPDETARRVSRWLVPHRRRGRLERRFVSAAGTLERGHHQDRRFQGVGARDRRDSTHPPGDCRVRGGRRPRRGLGRTCVRGRGTANRCDALARRAPAVGEGSSSRRTRCRAHCRRFPHCRAMRWARSSSRKLPGSSNRANLRTWPPRRLLVVTAVAATLVAAVGVASRPALLPRRQLRHASRAAANARRLLCRLSSGVSQRPSRTVRHRLADRLSICRDQSDDAPVRTDEDARESRRESAPESTRYGRSTRRSSIARFWWLQTPARPASRDDEAEHLRDVFTEGRVLLGG